MISTQPLESALFLGLSEPLSILRLTSGLRLTSVLRRDMPSQLDLAKPARLDADVDIDW